MFIKKIDIENFRSIKEGTIEIKDISGRKCFIFLGLNGSGKSNVLKSLSLLDGHKLARMNYAIDCYSPSQEEYEEIKISYEVGLRDPNFFKEKFIGDGWPKEAVNQIDIKEINRCVTVDYDNNKHNFFEIDVVDKAIFKNYVIKDKNIVKISDIYAGKKKISESNINILIGEGASILTGKRLGLLLNEKYFDFFNARIPGLLYWENEQQYMINNPINLNDFKNNPNISIPLRNIFYIAGIEGEEIAKKIDFIHDSKSKRKQLEEKLSSAITKHVNSKWPEHRINIGVDIEDMKADILIEDKDNTAPKYAMRERSDGFKQFISMLLSFSAENKAETLKDTIIVLDEPETHLHPSGVRYLRDELLEISKNNIVFIATHSIYMVDKTCLERHFKIDKEKSETKIIPIGDNPYIEEVVYEALGASVLETIEPNMIIFSSKQEKDVFDAFNKKFKISTKKVSTISVPSLDRLPLYAKYFNNGLVAGYIALDSDGEVILKEILTVEGYNKDNAFTVNDVVDTKKEATFEDLFPAKVIKDMIKSEYDIKVDLVDSKPIIKQLEEQSKNLKSVMEIEDFRKLFAAYVLKDIVKLNLTEGKVKYKKYHDFVSALLRKIK